MRRLTVLLALSVLVAAGWLSAGDDKHQWVKIREVRLKEAPKPLAKAGDPLGYGARVEVVRKEGAWCEVRLADGKSGWLHASSLSPKKIVLKAGADDAMRGASADEVAQAGKGFNPEVEAEYKSAHADIAPKFEQVDRISDPKGRIPVEAILKFLSEGGLKSR